MCGLTGYLVPASTEWRPSKDFINYMALGVESRGTDATGYFTITEGATPKRCVLKGAITASKFKPYLMGEKVPVGNLVMVHTRSWTTGHPKYNENNHPLLVGGTAIMHNGTIANYDEILTSIGVEDPIADVDSVSIAYVLDKMGAIEGMRYLEDKAEGVAAITAVLPGNDLLLARYGKPLYVAKMPHGGFMWSSEADACLDHFPVKDDFSFNGVLGRFPHATYMIFNGKTGAVKHTGTFLLAAPKTTNRKYKNTLCSWGMCKEEGTKGVTPADCNYIRWACKRHKKMVVARGMTFPKHGDSDWND